MLSEATSIPADALAGEVAIARKNRYLVGAERLQRRLEKWSWVLQNRARLYSGASNALAVPVVNAITPARFYSDQIGSATGRERVCQYVEIQLVADTLKKKKK